MQTATPGLQPDPELLYQDKLVRITGNSIEFFHYTFPLLRSKVIPLSAIDHIDVRKPSIINGKWRLWGSGNFITWFPLDAGRPIRDRIFVVTLNDRRSKIGFTVVDSASVIRVLNGRGVQLIE